MVFLLTQETLHFSTLKDFHIQTFCQQTTIRVQPRKRTRNPSFLPATRKCPQKVCWQSQRSQSAKLHPWRKYLRWIQIKGWIAIIHRYLKLPSATSNLASQRHQQLLAMLSNKSKFVIHPTAILIYLIQWYSPQSLCIFSKERIQTNR